MAGADTRQILILTPIRNTFFGAEKSHNIPEKYNNSIAPWKLV